MGSVCDKGVSSAGVLTASVPVREFRTAAEHEGKARASVAPAYQGFSPCACPTQAPRGGSGRYKHLPCEELARASWSASVNPRFKLIFYPAILPQNFGLKFDGVHTARTSSASSRGEQKRPSCSVREDSSSPTPRGTCAQKGKLPRLRLVLAGTI